MDTVHDAWTSPAAADDLAREVLARVADRWSVSVLCVLAEADAPLRFSRLHKGASGVTQKVLTATLRHLERDGFVTRTVFAEVPPRVEYALTGLGRELFERIDPLFAWARDHVRDFRDARRRFESR